MDLVDFINTRLSHGSICPFRAREYQHDSVLKERIRNYQQHYLQDINIFLQKSIESSSVYHPPEEWSSGIIPVRGNILNNKEEPYKYIYASFLLEHDLVVTLKLVGIRTNHYYEMMSLSTINQSKEWEQAYEQQCLDDSHFRPTDNDGEPYHKHYFPLEDPKKYAQAILFSENTTSQAYSEDPRKLNCELIFTQKGNSVSIRNIDTIRQLHELLVECISEFQITGVR